MSNRQSTDGKVQATFHPFFFLSRESQIPPDARIILWSLQRSWNSYENQVHGYVAEREQKNVRAIETEGL